MKSQIEAEEEKMNFLIKKVKNFLLGNFLNIRMICVSSFSKMYTQTS
jgi:hypothetical protein